jgi:hypothetical protein
MAVWARSERTFAIDAGRWGGLLKRPSFFGCGHRAGAGLLCAWDPNRSKLRVKKSVCAVALYLADEGSGVVAVFTSRNHAWAVSPGA